MSFFQWIRLNVNNNPNLSLWLLVFIVILFIILLVQLVLLAHIFPSWHAGDGLLVGGDWIRFQKAAVAMAERINSEGWSAWELRPRGWFPAGIAGAVYALTWTKPWTLAPLNAAVHATTFLLVVKLCLLFVDNRRAAILAALPFAFFPSAMLWYTQIHRDGYYILGLVLFIYGLLLIINLVKRGNIELLGFISALCGLVIIWLVRPHSVAIFYYTTLMLSILVILALVVLFARKMVTGKKFFTKLILIALLVAVIIPLKETEGAFKYLSAPEETFEPQFEEVAEAKEEKETHRWTRTPWLPESIDNQFYSMALLRTETYPARFGEAASSIDFDVSFHSVNDFIFYLPRALQVAFLAPFPVDWFGEGGHSSTTFFRRVSAFEMVFTYLMLLSLIYGIWIWRKRIELYILVLFCTVMMLPIVYAVPNVGTVYRYRYGFLMLLVSLGVVALYRLVQDWRKRRNETGNNLPVT